jgi:hypothetical protein
LSAIAAQALRKLDGREAARQARRSTTPPTHARPDVATVGPQWLMESLIHPSTGKNLPTSMVNNSLLPGPGTLHFPPNKLKMLMFPDWHGFR